MITKSLHIAAAQIHSGGGPQETLKRLERQVGAAAAVGAEVILFAEGVLQGYDYDMDRALVERLAVTADDPDCTRLVRLASRYRIAIMAGFLERDGNAFYNSVLVARTNGNRQVQRKHGLTPGELKAGLTAGPRERTVFEFNGVRCVIIICADGGIEGLPGHLKELGAEYRFCPTGGGGKIQDYLHESDLQTEDGRKRYIDNRPRVFNTQAILEDKDCPWCGFTSANALGPIGKQTCHQGHCMIVDNQRVMRAQLPGTIVLEHQQDQMIHAQLNF